MEKMIKWLLNRLRNKSFVMTKYVFYFHVSDRIQNNLLLFSVNQEKQIQGLFQNFQQSCCNFVVLFQFL